MYDVANEIVGNVGPKVEAVIKNGVIKTTPENIALFCLKRVSPEYSEIMDIWTKWIKAYCMFKKHHTPELAIITDDPNLIVRWTRNPYVGPEGVSNESIKKYPAEHKIWECHYGGKPNEESPEYFLIRAYLSILRVDCNSFAGK